MYDQTIEKRGGFQWALSVSSVVKIVTAKIAKGSLRERTTRRNLLLRIQFAIDLNFSQVKTELFRTIS